MNFIAEPPAGRPRKARYAATVQHVQRLTPRMVRIVFGGPALAAFNWNGPAAHIKLIFGSDTPEQRAPSRTYTPRHFDPATHELTVDFVLHGEGPASTWAEQAQAGQPMLIAGPGRCYTVEPLAQWLLIGGDESAIPAIATILEVVPDSLRIQVLLEVSDAGDEFTIVPPRPNVDLRWLHRRSGAALLAAVAAFEPPPGNGQVYVACEADAMRTIRRYLLTERALPREWVTTRGYWKQGATDHPDRDYGEDAD